MKNRQRIASIVLACTIGLGGSVVAAAPAQASVTTQCYNYYHHNTHRLAGSMRYVRYNVVEKLFGWRDQWFQIPGRAC